MLVQHYYPRLNAVTVFQCSRLKEMEAHSILLRPNDFRKDSYLSLPFLLQFFLLFEWFLYFIYFFLPLGMKVFIYGVWLLLFPELWWSAKKPLHLQGGIICLNWYWAMIYWDLVNFLVNFFLIRFINHEKKLFRVQFL